MFVKDFAESVASIAKEVACDGGTSIGSHKIRSSISVFVDGDDNEDAEYELVEVEPSMLPGCGCWDGVILRVKRTVPNKTDIAAELAVRDIEIESLRQQLNDAFDEKKILSQRVKELESKAEMDYAIMAGDNILITSLKEELAALKAGQGKPVAWVKDFWYQVTPEDIPELKREYFSSQVDGAVPLYTTPTIPEGLQLVPIDPKRDPSKRTEDNDEHSS